MEQATNYGSLIIPKSSQEYLENGLKEIEKIYHQGDVFRNEVLERLKIAVKQLLPLSKKYHCIVDNPPYMGGGNMNKVLADFVKKNYPLSKADLMVCFMNRTKYQLFDKGLVGMINLPSWMFLSSFEEYRKELLSEYKIDTLLHLGRGVFGSDFGSVAFTLIFKSNNFSKGIYRRLFKEHVQVRNNDKIRKLFLDEKYGYYESNQESFKKIPGSPLGYWLSDNIIDNFNENKLGESAQIKKGLSTGSVERFMRFWHEVDQCKSSVKSNYDYSTIKWVPYLKGGEFRRWNGNLNYVVNWADSGTEIVNFKDEVGKQRSRPQNVRYYFNKGITYSALTSYKYSTRYMDSGYIFGGGGDGIFIQNEEDIFYFIGLLNSVIAQLYLSVISPTLNYEVSHIQSIPVKIISKNNIDTIARECVNISLKEWNSHENSWEFNQNELIRIQGQDIEECFDLFKEYWKNKFFHLHKNEEELNRQFIEIYRLQDELTPDVPLEDITILKEETVIENNQLVFKEAEVFAQFMSYAVGCMFGRYSLDMEALILANQGDTLQAYLEKVGKSKEELTFAPDEDNIIPVLDDEWFEDDITARFYAFLKASFGEANFNKNLAFVENCLGMDVRKYFVKGFYPDHIKRYKKRPIYWMFSSPKGAFNVLIYMQRYTPDTINNILNGYLREFIQKLKSTKQHYRQVQISGSVAEQNKAIKQIDRLDKMISDCEAYEREILFPLATERISIDLDDGVLVNYNKMGNSVMEVAGLNDKATKKKVREFDWINVDEIRG